jgi:hypothetical protein
MSRIVHVLAIEIHDVIEHALGLYGGAVRIEVDGLYVAVDGFMPQALLAIGVALLIVVLGGLFQIDN